MTNPEDDTIDYQPGVRFVNPGDSDYEYWLERETRAVERLRQSKQMLKAFWALLIAVAITLGLMLLFVQPARADDCRPRYPRILFLTIDSCQHCKSALVGPQSFPGWLILSGWDVGYSDRCHVQIVDCSANPERQGVETYPALVLVTAEGAGKAVSYSGRESIVRMFK